MGGNNGNNFSLDTVRYDRNGNIQQLKRHTIDNLSYIYDGNKLLSVSDAGNTSGFNDGNTSGNDYGYWNDGSLKYDKNKGIDSIFYNSFLRKVSRVKFSNGNWINFYYDGAGMLLKRIVHSSTINDVWIYMDDLILKNGLVYQYNHEEGRITYDNTNSKWIYEYDYRDHLDNLRLSFRDSSVVGKPPVIVQIHETDPFGLQIGALSFENSGSNTFKFQNQEKINDFGLNWNFFKYRFSDGETGRFFQIDPLTSKYQMWSPYTFSGNMVTNAREIEGLEPYIITGRSFIPNENVPNPMPLSNTQSFAGDNRNSYQVNSTAYRTEQKVKVDFDNNKVTVLNNKASGSKGFDENKNVTQVSASDKAGPNPTYSTSTLENKSTTVNMKIDAPNKLVSLSPAINYDVNITITEQSNKTFDFKISGKTDGFPAYEFFITNEATGKSYFIYGSNPASTGDTPTSLFPPMENKINSSGNSGKLKPVNNVKF